MRGACPTDLITSRLTAPRSLGALEVAAGHDSVRRVPCGTAPILWGAATVTRSRAPLRRRAPHLGTSVSFMRRLLLHVHGQRRRMRTFFTKCLSRRAIESVMSATAGCERVE
jgi:hypothetical protein